MKLDELASKKLSKLLQKLDENVFCSDICNSFLNNKVTLNHKSDPKEELTSSLKESFDHNEFKIFKNSFLNNIHELDPKIIEDDWFAKKLAGKNYSSSNWELYSDYFSKGEMFLSKETTYDASSLYKENIHIGFFNKDVFYPSIRQEGRKWMSIVPHEISSMKNPIDFAFGNVLVLGLGMGYYALSVAKKDNVETVTVIESDQSAIDIYIQCISKEFPEENRKVKIIKADAFDYYSRNQEKHDFCFADIWFNEFDGSEAYLQLKKQEKIPTIYWIEGDILLFVRRILLICLESASFNQEYSSDNNAINRISSIIMKRIKAYDVINMETLDYLVSDDGIKDLLFND